MGRFDALTQLDETQAPVESLGTPPVDPTKNQSPSPQQENRVMQEAQKNDTSTHSPIAISPIANTQLPQIGKKQSTNGKKPATMQTGKSLNALQQKQDKFEKYSTYLRPGYRKMLKSIALERDCDAYEVLDEALTLFLEIRKK
jgi:hypothetical protein